MIIEQGKLQGTRVLTLDRKSDDRGFFARTFCERELLEKGVEFPVRQCNVSYNEKRGTLRGMHYQAPPHEESKIVWCLSGRVFDVVVDLRHDSPSFGEYMALELSAENGKMLYIPKGFAHGFLTLEDQTALFYWMSEFYQPGAERGLRYNDPALDLEWPFEPVVISDRDQTYADFKKELV